MSMQEDRKWSFGPDHLGQYMRRWLLRTPWFTFRIHKIQRSDAGRDFHDHPFNFTSLILRGGYIEHRPGCTCVFFEGRTWSMPEGPCRVYLPGDVVHRDATAFHRLELLDETRPTWTAVVTSGYFRDWGFMLKDGSWVHADVYRADSEVQMRLVR